MPVVQRHKLVRVRVTNSLENIASHFGSTMTDSSENAASLLNLFVDNQRDEEVSIC
jgi:hypothetical protein